MSWSYGRSKASVPARCSEFRRWSQRRPAQAVGSILAFVLLVVLPTTLLVQQWRANKRISRAYEAEQASSVRADEAVFEALGVIDQILLPATDPRLRADPATRGLQRKMLDSVSGMMSRLGELSEKASPPVRRRSHEVLLQLAKLRGSAGDFDESCAAFDAAIERLQRQVAEDPGNFELRGVLASAHYSYANLMSDFSRGSEALASLKESEGLYVRLIAEKPGRVDMNLALAVARGLRARTILTAGDYGGAREVAAAVAQDLEALRVRDPNNLAIGRELAAQYATVSWVDVAFGNTDQAIDGLRKVLPLAASASSVAVDSILGVIHLNLGLALAASGDFKEAGEHLAVAVKEIDRTMQEVGDSAHYGSQLTRALLHAAEIELDQGDLAEARAHFERSIALGSRLAEIYPQRYDILRSLANGNGSLADLDRESGEHDLAIVRYRQAIEWLEQVILAAPEQLDHENQCHNWNGLAFTHVAAGDLEAGLSAVDHAVEQVALSLRSGPADDRLLVLHRGVLFDRSGFRLQVGRHREAIEDVTAAVSIVPDATGRSKAVQQLTMAIALAEADTTMTSPERASAIDRYAEAAVGYLEIDILGSDEAAAILALPAFDGLREHPDFQALADKVGSPNDG